MGDSNEPGIPQTYKHIRLEYLPKHAIIWMQREPVNTMDTAMWEELSQALTLVESNPKMQAVAFMSGIVKDVFTAGNDIQELYAPNTSKDRYRTFWKVSNTFLGRLYLSRLVTIAGIRGACPAGGCCLSLCCDYRIMTRHGYIGLNEVALGISVPKYWAKIMERTIGPGKAEKLVQFARLVKTPDAHAMGLVDEMCDDGNALYTAVVARMDAMVGLPERGRAETKLLLRSEFVHAWMGYLDEEAEHAWELLSSPETVYALGKVLEKLSRGGGKRKATGKSKL